MSANVKPDSRYRCLAVNDEQSTCCCCGRKGLRRVVWLLDNENPDDEPAHYGTTCAAHLLLGRLPDEPKPKVAAADRAIAEALEAEQRRVASELLEGIAKLVVPEVTQGINKWGVVVAVCGGTELPFHGSSLGRLVPLRDMLAPTVREWTLDQVSAAARERGLDRDSWKIREQARCLLVTPGV